jgi:hypothetical protein
VQIWFGNDKEPVTPPAGKLTLVFHSVTCHYSASVSAQPLHALKPCSDLKTAHLAYENYYLFLDKILTKSLTALISQKSESFMTQNASFRLNHKHLFFRSRVHKIIPRNSFQYYLPTF